MKTQSRKVNSLKNMLVGVINQVSILFLNMAATTFFIKKLGAEYLGINGLFSNLFILLSFAEFGIGTVMIYSLYEPFAREDTKKIADIYKFFKKVYLLMTLVSIFVGILLIPFLKYIVNTKLAISNIVLYYLLFLISMIIYNMFAYKTNLVIADQKRYIVGLYRFFFHTFTVILQIFCLLFTSNFTYYLILALGKNIIYSFFVSRKVNAVYPFIKDSEANSSISLKEKKLILKKIREVFSYNFSQSLLTGTDNIIISMLVGTVWVGYYSNYYSIITGVMSLVEAVYMSISASIGNLMVEQKAENQYKVFKITGIINFWITGFTTTCLYVLLQDFIVLWIGKKYLFDMKILLVLIINYYLNCSRNSIKVFREAAGMFEKVKYVMILAAAINLALSLLLGTMLGVFGILLATTIATLTTYYWYEAKLLMESKFGGSLLTYMKEELKGFSLTVISIFTTSLFVSWINEVTIYSFIIKLCICMVVPNICYFIALRKEEEFGEVLRMIVKTCNRFRNSRYGM